jgi:hypothetical protein
MESLLEEMCQAGIVILTCDADGYTAYWARRSKRPVSYIGNLSTVDPVKPSVEGQGKTALEALNNCKVNADKPAFPRVAGIKRDSS